MRTSFAISGIIFLFTLLCATLYWTFSLRFESGDIYPEGSTLNADPEGCMIFYESLASIPDLSVTRNRKSYERLMRTVEHGNTVLFMLGASSYDLDNQELESYIKSGGHLVVTMYESNWSVRSNEPSSDDDEAEGAKKHEKSPIVHIETPPLIDEAAKGVARRKLDNSAPAKIYWHSAQVFDADKIPEGWTTIFSLGEHPVVLEKEMEEGRIIILANNYLLSNEAMFRHRHPKLYSWLLAGSESIIFDEYHLGTVEPRGLTALLLSYNLEWLFVGFMLPFLLYVWKGLIPLLPQQSLAYESEQSHQTSLQGFRNLIARYQSPAEALSMCLEEWKQTKRRMSSSDIRRLDEARELLRKESVKKRRQQNFHETYRNIHAILNKKG